MPRRRIRLLRHVVRCRHWISGLDRYGEPLSYFGPGGVAEAERLCAEANRDVLAFLRPAVDCDPEDVEAAPVSARGRFSLRAWSFGSPAPSGNRHNDRVHVRVYAPDDGPPADRVVLFHHPLYQRTYGLWENFLGPLVEHVPVALMAGPWHFERAQGSRFPGEGTINPNPYRLYESLRQWCHDHDATVRLLEERAGLRVVAEVGYSLGGFQVLMLAAAGGIDVPLVTVSSTNRYAWGLYHGLLGHELKRGMQEVGIDYEKLAEMTRELEVERHVAVLRDRPTMYVYGGHDYVDPPPSLDRLVEALRPTRTLFLPWTGHAAIAFRGRRVMPEVRDFLCEAGVLAGDPPPGAEGSAARA